MIQALYAFYFFFILLIWVRGDVEKSVSLIVDWPFPMVETTGNGYGFRLARV